MEENRSERSANEGDPKVTARPPRRVVTGHDGSGASIVLSDGPTPRSHDMGVAVFHEVWNTRAVPASISATEPEPTERPLVTPPDPGGTIIRYTDIKPGQSSPMHRTESVDYGIVLEGEVYLELGGGGEVLLRPGDIVIQRGTDHVWANRTESTARMAFILVDGKFTPELKSTIGDTELYDQALDAT